MDTVKIKVNGIETEVAADSLILDACTAAGVRVPTLCFLRDINEIGACRMCIVETSTSRGLVASCVNRVSEGMEIRTSTPRLHKARKTTLELILSNHRMDCLSCRRSMDCELQALAREYGVDQAKFSANEDLRPQLDESAPHLVRDNSKCILCRRCTAVCSANQYVGVIGANERGFNTHIGSPFDIPLNSTSCVYCGQCIAVCPTGALTEKDDTGKVWRAFSDESKYVVVGTAPSVRAQIGECFDLPIGTNVDGRLVAALRRLGFAKVFNVDTAADLTILEEGTELLHRLSSGGPLPLITSCSPGWIKFCEHYYPEMLDNISTCKSPQQMYGAMMKTYYAEKEGIKPEDMFVVSIMPCTAKKFEVTRDEGAAGVPDVDVSLTTRELAEMIKRAGIDFVNLPDEEFDPVFGIASGAAQIFGATGGVMEAALRTVYEIVTGQTLEALEFYDVRGVEGIKEAEYDLNGTVVRVAVSSGLANAHKLLEMVKSGEKDYHFIEIMACPGGCVNGGGQPCQPGFVRNNIDLRAERAKALYSGDQAMALRKSHENPAVNELYATFLGEPGSHKAHETLHTHYKPRELFNED